MKIMFLIPSLEPGGAERQLVQLANGLAGRGHSVGVALFRRTGALLDDLNPTVALHDLEKGGKADIFGFLWRAVRLFRSKKPDVIYSFLGVPNLVTAALKPFLSRSKIVWSVRASDMDLSEYSLLSRLCWRMECTLSGVADVIIANSAAGRRHVEGQGFPSEKMHVVPNGIDTDRFLPDRRKGAALRRELGCAPETMLIGHVARLDPMKDHETFFRAAKLVVRDDPETRLACVGGGPLADSLRRRAEELGLGNVVHWLGSRQDMDVVYNALDVCCLSSAYGEGFPNVLAEAMACGVPCVTTDVGDAAEVVGETGIVVPRRDVAALEHGLRETTERIRSGKAGNPRARVKREFSLARMVERTENLLCGEPR